VSHPAIIRVAVIGLGWAARSIWLTRLLSHPSFVVTAVVDPDPAARAAVRREGVDTRSFASVAELDAATLDLAVLAVPNHLHSSMACELLYRGISVFVEKPVCLTAAEADQLASAELAGPGMLLAGSAARYRADIQRLHAVVEQIGALRHVEVSWIRARGVPGAGGWFSQRQLSGGGALVDLGWHLLDVVSLLLGPVDFSRVVGTTSNDFIRTGAADTAWRADRPAMNGSSDVEDTARGFLVTGSGVSVSLSTSWASHELVDVTSIRVYGRDGTADLRCTFGFTPIRVPRSALSRTRLGETTAIPVPNELIGAEYDRQLDAIPAMLVDPASRGRAAVESRRTVSVIERLYDSAHQYPVATYTQA